MKKVILTFVFLGVFTVSNAENLMEYNDKCHAVACAHLASMEEVHGDLNESDANTIYEQAYSMCTGPQEK